MTPAELGERRSTLRELCKEHGRREDAVQVSLRANVTLGDPVQSDTGDRTPLTGTADDIVDDLHRYEDAGLEYLVLSLVADDTDSTIDRVKRFANEIAPRV